MNEVKRNLLPSYGGARDFSWKHALAMRRKDQPEVLCCIYKGRVPPRIVGKRFFFFVSSVPDCARQHPLVPTKGTAEAR